jgi:(2Fe-2S) ferredoxin
MQTQVFETLPKDRWYTMVVDKNALRVISSHLKLSDLLEYNVSVVDPLELARKPGKDVVYIISPLPTSMRLVIEDFQGPKPSYESARIFFTSKASEELLDMLKSCITLVKRLSALKEVRIAMMHIIVRTCLS